MSTLGPKERVMPLVVVQMVITREAVIAHHLRHQSLNSEKSKLHAARRGRDPPKVGRHIHETLVIDLCSGTREAHSQRIDQRLRKRMHVFERKVLIARALLSEHVRRLVSNLPLHVSVVECVAAKQDVFRGKTMIDSALREVLIGRLQACEGIPSRSGRFLILIKYLGPIRAREKNLQ